MRRSRAPVRRVRERKFKFCPKCGCDLEALEPVRFGDLYADPLGSTFWKGQEVNLNASERIILHSLLTGSISSHRGVDRASSDAGHYVAAHVIAERADISADSVKQYLSRMRTQFRAIDPEFDHIESGKPYGYRWAEAAVKRPIASWGPFVLYERGECLWRSLYRVFLTQSQSIILRALLEARGEPLSLPAMAAAVGWSNHGAVSAQIVKMRRRFAEADGAPAIVAIRRTGTFVVKPEWIRPLSRREQQVARPAGARSTRGLKETGPATAERRPLVWLKRSLR